jgi:histidyl-tRNA synthetase
MQSNKIERVQGFVDALATDCDVHRQIETKLRQAFEAFGYQSIAVPIVEMTELYLRKSGEEIIDRLYDFEYRNRRLCLRPEMTASVMRAYIDHLATTSLPVRLSYAGPVFRYEKPQQSRFRQFTQIGVEFIGASGAMADAEVIRLACRGLDAIGLSNYQIVLGHIGVLNRFLDGLDLENRLRSLLLANIDQLKQAEGKQQVEALLKDIYVGFDAEVEEVAREPEEEETSTQEEMATETELQMPLNANQLMHLFQGMTKEDAKQAILSLLESLNIGLGGNREPNEIAERLLTKLKRQNQTPQISQAINFISDIAQLRGEPQQVLAAGSKLLANYGLDASPLQELHSIVQTLQAYNLDPSRICLDLGLSRGLQYYTGMIFEIHHGTGDDRQLCGGGRYDDLVGVLGGVDTPATGFAYGLERLKVALGEDGVTWPSLSTSQIVLVTAATLETATYAIRVSEQLRQHGVPVELSSEPFSTSQLACQFARDRQISTQIWVGEHEQTTATVVLNLLRSGEQRTLTIAEVVDYLSQL